jgi:hypothetical protein
MFSNANKQQLHELFFKQVQLLETIEKEYTEHLNHTIKEKDAEILVLVEKNTVCKERIYDLMSTIVDLTQKLLNTRSFDPSPTPPLTKPKTVEKPSPVVETEKGNVEPCETVHLNKKVKITEVVTEYVVEEPAENEVAEEKEVADEEEVVTEEEVIEEEVVTEEEVIEEEVTEKEVTEEEVTEEEVTEEEVTEEEVVEEKEVEEEVEEEVKEEEEVEEEVTEEEEDELIEVEIKGNTYYTLNTTDGIIYKLDENDEPTIEAGIYKNGKPKFYKLA